MSLAGIFNDDQPILFRQFENRIHVDHLPVQMNRDDGGDGPIAPLADEFTVRRNRALCRQVLAQFQRIHVVSAFVDVDELRQGARLRDRFGGCDEGIWHSHGHVAGLYPSRNQCKTERICTAADGYRAFGLAEGGKLFFEILDHGTTDEAGAPQCLLENRC